MIFLLQSTDNYIKATGIKGVLMATVFDVAKYILLKSGRMTTVKLQKLVYYCQAWSLVWEEKPLFDEKIEAWMNGPVTPVLFNYHKGKFYISQCRKGNVDNLSTVEKESIDAVLKYYGDKSAQWLIDLTHLEDPWREARAGCAIGEKCKNEITLDSMMNYYSGL